MTFRKGFKGAEVAPPGALAQRHTLGGDGASGRSAREDHGHTDLAGPLTVNPGPLTVAGGTTATDRLVLGTDVELYRNAASQLRLDDLLVLGNATAPGASVTAALIAWAEGGGLRTRTADGDVSPLAPIRLLSAAATSDLALGTSAADVPGATTGAFTTRVANALAIVLCRVDFRVTTVGTGFCNAYMDIDGSSSGVAFFGDYAAQIHIHSAHIVTTLVTAGSHTIKLRGNKNSAGGAAAIDSDNTRLDVVVIG